MRARARRWWLSVGIVASLVVIALGVLVVLFITREDPGARSIDEAVEEFRSDTDGGGTSPGDGASAGGPPVGVYLLEGSGTESLSFPPLSQSDGETMPMTVGATDGGCWTVRIDYNEAHWQDWNLCRDGDSVIENGGSTFQRWDLGATTIENTSTFVCEPPVVFVDLAASEGDTAQRSCTGINDAVGGETLTSGTDTVVGVEEIPIGGEPVEAVHVRSDQTVSGAQTGTVEWDFWFRTSDGLPLRGQRSSMINSDSPVGTITYDEDGTWELTSTEPEG
jgi:hypothetical protein